MKKLIPLLLVLMSDTGLLYSQEQDHSASHPNSIKSGFYMKFGPSFPMGNFKGTQYVIDYSTMPDDTVKTFDQPKVGFFGDLGYLIYLGPAFAKNYLRAGIDATFLSGGFNPSHHEMQDGENKINYYYFFGGQKFGPVITVNPVDRLMIDLSWKLGFYAAGYNDDWGYTMAMQEIMMGIRYRILAFSINYQLGKIDYNDFNKDNDERWADLYSLKIMIGLKF